MTRHSWLNFGLLQRHLQISLEICNTFLHLKTEKTQISATSSQRKTAEQTEIKHQNEESHKQFWTLRVFANLDFHNFKKQWNKQWNIKQNVGKNSSFQVTETKQRGTSCMMRRPRSSRETFHSTELCFSVSIRTSERCSMFDVCDVIFRSLYVFFVKFRIFFHPFLVSHQENGTSSCWNAVSFGENQKKTNK